MKTHKEIKIPSSQILLVLKCDYSERISRDLDKEKTLELLGEKQYCLEYQCKNDSVSIWLKLRHEYYVITNILADERDIEIDEYNQIIDELFQSLSSVEGIKISSGESSLTDSLPSHIINLLAVFLRHCNAESPFAHAFDCQRWAKFIKACAIENFLHIDSDEFEEFVIRENSSIDLNKQKLFSHYEHDVEIAMHILDLDGNS